LRLARGIVEAAIPYVAFGGGEPLGVPHVWEVFEILSQGGVAIKIETDGLLISDAAALRLKRLGAECVQVSIDGARAGTHERLRPGGDFRRAAAAVERLSRRGVPAEVVFVPSRLGLPEIEDAYDLAVRLGARAFVTGPLMRLGRAHARWDSLAPSREEWERAAGRLEAHAASRGGPIRLSIYPWDIVAETQARLESPQAMLLVVPDGKVKLLNALPFSPADLRSGSVSRAWEACLGAWKNPAVADFVRRIPEEPNLLRHANETWPL
jgi:MoaA/NifB/PqqE/SkfB family radical SAM enzyme